MSKIVKIIFSGFISSFFNRRMRVSLLGFDSCGHGIFEGSKKIINCNRYHLYISSYIRKIMIQYRMLGTNNNGENLRNPFSIGFILILIWIF